VVLNSERNWGMANQFLSGLHSKV